MRLALPLFALCASVARACVPVSDRYDARRLAPQCAAFTPVLQTGCLSCCAAAVAAASSARACIVDGVTGAFSVQRVWDCAPPTLDPDTDCAEVPSYVKDLITACLARPVRF